MPGLVALVAHGEQVHVEALGSLTIGGPAVPRDSLFRISSTTKPVTGAATLALVGEGPLPSTSGSTGCCRSWLSQIEGTLSLTRNSQDPETLTVGARGLRHYVESLRTT